MKKDPLEDGLAMYKTIAKNLNDSYNLLFIDDLIDDIEKFKVSFSTKNISLMLTLYADIKRRILIEEGMFSDQYAISSSVFTIGDMVIKGMEEIIFNPNPP